MGRLKSGHFMWLAASHMLIMILETIKESNAFSFKVRVQQWSWNAQAFLLASDLRILLDYMVTDVTSNMHYFKTHYALMIVTIIWLNYLQCFCNPTTTDYSTSITVGLSNETKEDIIQGKQPDKLAIGGINSSGYHVGISLASWRWKEIDTYYTVSLFIIITGLSKVAFHHAEWLSSHVPESCLLIIVGVIVGAIIFAVTPSGDPTGTLPTFTPRLFFLILLPPVILESAYSLYNATFFENLSTILLYAVVGTIFNTFSIGLLLYGLNSLRWMGDWYNGNIKDVAALDIDLPELFVFSALISAVDPVAVLAIFQEVGVNKDLYFLIFGESLLNDAITVVLYNTMVAMAGKAKIETMDYTLAVLSFFTVNFGGMALGIFFGLLTAIITKTTSEVRVVEPLAVLGMAYLSYLTAELFHFSGIISIIICGLLQAHYSFKNISEKSYVTVKYFTKMVSATSEAIIFLFLGLVLLSHKHVWETEFIFWSILLCLICRFIGVFGLTAIANIFRVKRIRMPEQFMMAYGGLRGAVGFSLVMMLNEHVAKAKGVYVTATLAVILFTVFIQGSTIKPLVKLLNIEISGEKHRTLIGEINNQVTSHLMAGIEEIIGFRGNYYFKRKLLDFDEKYLQKIFLRDQSGNRLRRVFEKTSLTYHYAHLYGPVTLIEDNKADLIHVEPAAMAQKLNQIPFVPDTHPVQYRKSGRTLSGIFPEVELRKKGETEVKPGLLRKAFHSNPFHRYFQRYNPNLIEDDTQEMDAQLELRLKRAKRITLAAYEPRPFPEKSEQLPSLSDASDESVTAARKTVQSVSTYPYTHEEIVGIENIIQRAQRRRTVSHSGSYSNEMGRAITAVPQSLSDIEIASPADRKRSSNEHGDRLHAAAFQAEGSSSSNMEATPSPSGVSSDREIAMQEKPLLLDSEKKGDSEDESKV